MRGSEDDTRDEDNIKDKHKYGQTRIWPTTETDMAMTHRAVGASPQQKDHSAAPYLCKGFSDGMTMKGTVSNYSMDGQLCFTS